MDTVQLVLWSTWAVPLTWAVVGMESNSILRSIGQEHQIIG